jgi:hypothetical protein
VTNALPASVSRDPPTTLPEIVDWFESLSYGLVILEPYPLADVRAAVDAFHERMVRHAADWATTCAGEADRTSPWSALRRVIESDHTWFETSFEQLRWFLGIVEGEDHGGHRQALGQYGRLVAEAVRRHLRDERRLLEHRRASAKG